MTFSSTRRRNRPSVRSSPIWRWAHLVQRARARLAWAVRAAAGGINRGAVQTLPRVVFAMGNSLHRDRNAFAGRRSLMHRSGFDRMCKRKLHTRARDTHCYKFGFLNFIIGWQSSIGAGHGALPILGLREVVEGENSGAKTSGDQALARLSSHIAKGLRGISNGRTRRLAIQIAHSEACTLARV